MVHWKGKGGLLYFFVCTLSYIVFKVAIAHAAGFALYEWSARANGMGGAVIASRIPDASALAYNPATMTEISSASMLAGATVIKNSATVQIGDVATRIDDQTFFVPHAFYIQPLSDKAWFGIGEFSRFGLGSEYPQGWPGRANIYDVQFNAYLIQPTMAFKCTDSLSVAFGLEIMKADIDIKRQILGLQDMHMTTDGYAIGGNLSGFYKISNEWATGFVAHSPMKLTGNGNVTFNVPESRFNNGCLTMNTTLPDSYCLGLSYTPTKRWNFEFDTIYTRWEQYKKMSYDFDAGIGLPDSDDMKYWKNVWRFQLGSEFKPIDWLTIRAGYIWDQEPIRKGYEDYMLPSNDRQLMTTGLGFIWNKWTLDFSYMYLWAKDRYSACVGTDTSVDFLGNHCHLIGASVGYTF